MHHTTPYLSWPFPIYTLLDWTGRPLPYTHPSSDVNKTMAQHVYCVDVLM